MGRIVSVALAIALVLGTASASRADVTMSGGKTVKLKDQTGTAKDQALIKFTKEPAFITRPPNPMCPTVSTIRLRTDTQDVLTTLDCTHWSLTGSGYAYHDITGGAGGVEKIVLAAKSAGGKLLLKIKGNNYGVNAITGPIAFLETQLTIDTASFCGRFESPPSTFQSNEAGKVGISGPSTSCIPPTPTATGTAADTATATATATATPTASSTNTATNTRTITPTRTATFTVPPGSTATDTPTPTPTPTPGGVPDVFRIDSISLIDPHLFVPIGTLSCPDGTNPPGVLNVFSANGEVSTLLNNDGDGDGYLDLNLLMLFRPLSQPPQAGSNFDIATGNCTPPVGGETCSPDGNPVESASYANQDDGICLSPIPGTTGPNNVGFYSPALVTPSAPCFDTASVTINFPFGVFTVPLQDVRAAATFVDDPADQLVTGLLQGFLAESDADSIVLPDSIILLGGQPVSRVLPGGMGNCAPNDDRDIGPMSQSGWYFYLNFTAHRVAWTGS